MVSSTGPILGGEGRSGKPRRNSTPRETVPDADAAREFYNKYDLKNILGKGVSSVVRRCSEKSTGKEFAVKIIDLSQEDYVNEQEIESIRDATFKEIRLLQMCANHPHIIELHETFVNSSCMFLVLELCRKGELFDHLTDVVAFSECRTREIMKQLLCAVEFMHSMNIAHRDLKPENILLDDKYNVKVTDFGFASEVSHSEELTDLCGTPSYLAPEVLRVSMYEDAPGYGKAVDMWACGVIMYTLLVGCPPFWHRNQVLMLKAILRGQYTFSSPEWNDIGSTCKHLISRMLTVDPNERITAISALSHPFFHADELSLPLSPSSVPSSKSSKTSIATLPVMPVEQARRHRFKIHVLVVMAALRLLSLYRHAIRPRQITVAEAREEPYNIRPFRHIIDASAFRIYGHWVKRATTGQNRGALFEPAPKRNIVRAAAAAAAAAKTTTNGPTNSH